MTELAAGTHAVLAATPNALRALLDGAPPELLREPLDEGWSIADVVAHLIVINERGLRERVEGMLAADNPTVPDVNEEESLAASGLRGRPASELLDRFESERAEVVAWLDTLSAADLARPGRHELVGPITAADVVHHMAYHDGLHVAQIARMLASPADRARGNMRKLG